MLRNFLFVNDILVIALFIVTNRFPKKFFEKMLFQSERRVKNLEDPPYEAPTVAIGVDR
jgi:hypothetical protein